MVKYGVIDKFYNFNLSKDFFRFSSFCVPINSYFFCLRSQIIFFSKSSFFHFYNILKRVRAELPQIFIVRLFLKGVGYKILRPRGLLRVPVYRFDLGYSVIRYLWVPKMVYSRHRRDKILMFGSVKGLVVGAAKLFINLKCPDVYKGKGIRDAVYTFKPKPGKQRLVFKNYFYHCMLICRLILGNLRYYLLLKRVRFLRIFA